MFDTRTPSLNPRQLEAVDHDGGPLLIVAGAGTGKTKTLVARVSRLIADGADPQRILLLTFSRRAAQEMLSRVAASSDDRRVNQIWGGTFHAIANRLLRSYGGAASLPPSFTVLDQGDATDLFGIVRNELGLGEKGQRFPRKETIGGIYSRMVNSQAKLGDVLETDYPWCAQHADELKQVFTEYTTHKRAHQVLDYDDLLLFWRGLTATAGIGDSLRGLFDHILIDEYQDTNPIQADIVRGMCRPDTDLTAVGDDAQAIYGFRSATVANMWAFTEHFPGGSVVALEQNYRSTPEILDVANAVLSQSTEHFDKNLWTTRSSGVQPELVTCHDEGEQSRYVCEAILDARERDIDLREQAVLVRAGHHSDALELELTRRDIPYVKYGGLKYLEAAHVKDMLGLLRILENPADQLAWHRVVGLIDGVGPATQRRLIEELGVEDEAVDALQRLFEVEPRVPAAGREQFAELRAALLDCSAEGIPPAEQIDRLRAFCALVFPSRYDNFDARLADIEQLGASAGAYNSRNRFLTEMTLDPPARTGDRAQKPHLDDDWLTISTIHSAKGCEWRSVYLLHAADGNLPSDMALGDDDGLSEELRLLYVALTRAQDELTVTFPLRYHVNRYASDDRHHLAQLSRFLEPVRDHFQQRATAVSSDPLIDIDLNAVGVADEVDAMLHALWD